MYGGQQAAAHSDSVEHDLTALSAREDGPLHQHILQPIFASQAICYD